MRALLAIVLLALSHQAISSERFYGEYHLGTSGIRHSDLEFRSIDGRLALGGYVADQIGVELTLGGPFRVGEDQDFSVQLENLATVSLRFESPPQSGLSAYILVGTSRFTISQRGVNSIGVARTVRESFQAASLSIGLRQQLGESRFSLVGAYHVHFIDEPIDIDTYTVGVRVAW